MISMNTSPRTRLYAAGVAALLVMGVTACSAGQASLPATDTAAGAPADARSLPESMPEDVPSADPSRKIARSASLTITVTELAPAAAALRQAAASFGGMVVSENLVTAPSIDETGEESRTMPSLYSTIVLSVPADRLDAALDAIAQVGDVTTRTVSAEDVTTQVVDVEARIATMRESIARLQALMRRAGTLTEIAAIEAELTRRQADLESLLAQQKVLSQLVEQSSISVTLMTRRQAEGISSGGFVSGLQAGWAAFLSAGRWLLTILGASLPFLLAAAVIVTPLLWWRRHHGRRPRAKASAASPASPDVSSSPASPDASSSPASPAPPVTSEAEVTPEPLADRSGTSTGGAGQPGTGSPPGAASEGSPDRS